MSQTGRRDTAAELALRHHLHRLGLRYRVDVQPRGMRRRVDVMFPRARVAILVHGCFWHWCPDHGNLPRANADFWRAKLVGNRSRDEDTMERLTKEGFRVVVVWEHEDPATAAQSIARLVRERTD
jgi:DNA mismatch endonuclease (patch repair protein)